MTMTKIKLHAEVKSGTRHTDLHLSRPPISLLQIRRSDQTPEALIFTDSFLHLYQARKHGFR